jgi:hypothetical protein
MGEEFRIRNAKIIIWPRDHNPSHAHVIIQADDIEFKVFFEDLRVEHVSATQLSAKSERFFVNFIKDNLEYLKERWHEIQKDQ